MVHTKSRKIKKNLRSRILSLQRSLRRRKAMRKRINVSLCKNKTSKVCRRLKRCKMTRGKRRYCRKKTNRRYRRRR
jgi:hypothetical protein